MRAIETYSVKPNLPEAMAPLLKIAKNMWWCWTPEATELFRRMDRQLWRKLKHNPIKLIASLSEERIEELVNNESFIEHLGRVKKELEEYMDESTWYDKQDYKLKDFKVAYFSAEFGIHESLPQYSGGLGILAGDHLKSASEIGVPLVGVGLAYRYGYFSQELDSSGWQREKYMENDFYNMSMDLVVDDKCVPVMIDVDFPGRKVYAQIWKTQVGRVPLYCMDTNVDKNAKEDRDITGWLYGGDKEMRIKQEIMLGIGGIKVLKALGEKISVYHINEGHSAFLILERIKNLMKDQKLSYRVAKEAVKASNVFTTHTPVPAGNDRFDPKKIKAYFEDYWTKIGIDEKEFMSLGRENVTDEHEDFCMTVLALKLSAFSNGVSELHGHVSRNMWQNLWPNLPEEDIPVKHVTNGIHIRTWISDEMRFLYDRYLGKRWVEDPIDPTIWERVKNISDEEIWHAHVRMKEAFVGYVRTSMKKQLNNRGASVGELSRADSVLDPKALTIGFARRFATYKRALLLFRDIDRIKSILTNPDAPVQLVFAGKAHPHDHPGKELIKQIVNIARREDLSKHIVFLEDYDIGVARYMVQSVDVWLNTPRRPLEASGTSGMKICPNGGLNLSILDGWWCEGYAGDNGWAIGTGQEYEGDFQDDIDCNNIYELLENEIVPMYYKRGDYRLPREWIQRMRRSMMTLSPEFNSNRQVRDYMEQFYAASCVRSEKIIKSKYKMAQDLVKWNEKIVKEWKKLKVDDVSVTTPIDISTGDDIEVSVNVSLGKISTDEIVVQLCYGKIDGEGNIIDKKTEEMKCGKSGDGKAEFTSVISCEASGRNGVAVRVLPYNENAIHCYETGLIAL